MNIYDIVTTQQLLNENEVFWVESSGRLPMLVQVRQRKSCVCWFDRTKIKQGFVFVSAWHIVTTYNLLADCVR
jgi:hypothetical protein